MSFEEECLKAHNELRAKHGVSPLTFSPSLSMDAKRFAHKLLEENALRSSTNTELGENIYQVRTNNPDFKLTGDAAVYHWYQKESEHDYSQEPTANPLKTGNFTQLIWKDSKELAIGWAQKDGRSIVVTRYAPCGNIKGQFCENVPPPLKSQCSLPKVVPSREQPPKTTPLKSTGDFNFDCLVQHNNYRAKHGVPFLELDPDLCKYSQEWADKLAELGTMKHRSQSTYGENIYSAWSSDPSYTITGGKAVDSWYDEIKFYVFGKEPSDLKAGHFTQVVWKNSQRLGVGVAKKNGHIYVVCNYSKPGNYVGEYVNNVPPPQAGTPSLNGQNPVKIPPQSSPVTRIAQANDTGDFNIDCLQQHNLYRAKHGVPPLELDTELCRYSQEWADKLLKLGVMQHRNQSTYGENIFSAWSSDTNYSVPGGKAVDSWYDEIKFYTFGQEPRDLKAGHFTQVIWKNSERLGVGYARSKGRVYVVCNYSPPGNYVGDYTSNVPPPLA